MPKEVVINSFSTPQCPEFNRLDKKWIDLAATGESWIDAYNEMSQHRASCELCQARMAEMTELARNALELEVKNEQPT